MTGKSITPEKLRELERHAAHAYSVWAEAMQKHHVHGTPLPSQRHGDWWLGYHEAIKDLQMGRQPQPAEHGLYPNPNPNPILEPGESYTTNEVVRRIEGTP